MEPGLRRENELTSPVNHLAPPPLAPSLPRSLSPSTPRSPSVRDVSTEESPKSQHQILEQFEHTAASSQHFVSHRDETGSL